MTTTTNQADLSDDTLKKQQAAMPRLKRAFSDYEDEKKEEAEFQRKERKRQEDQARRARQAYLARSPPRWHEVVMDDGTKRNVYLSSSSRIVKRGARPVGQAGVGGDR
jgi:hypothetical protein